MNELTRKLMAAAQVAGDTLAGMPGAANTPKGGKVELSYFMRDGRWVVFARLTSIELITENPTQ